MELLRRLAFGGVRVSQLSDAATIDGVSYPAGTWIVPTDQEFAAMAREVLDVQRYPDLRQYPGGPPERPYDAAGWTLPLQMGVNVVAAASPLPADARARMKLLGPMPDVKVKPTPYSRGHADAAAFDSVPGSGFDTEPSAAAIVPPAGRTDRHRRDRSRSTLRRTTRIARSTAHGRAARRSQFAQRPLRRAADSATRQQADLVKSLALVAERTSASGTPVKKPRIGLFRPWSGSMDEGWTRWVLEQYGFEYITLRPVDFKTPLTGKVDVVILADDARLPMDNAAAAEAAGVAAVAAGAAVTSVPNTPTGCAEDLAAFEQFIRGGGTLVCLNSASTFAIQQFKLPVKNVVAGIPTDQFFLHGTIVGWTPIRRSR